MAAPRVTTIIPSYNHAAYIAQAIESVLAQDYSNHELIVVDDGSSDGSPDVIARYRGHPLVKVILNEQNCGQSAVLRQGLGESDGEFIALLPSDDWLLPNRIRVQVDRFQQVGDRVGIVYGRGRRFYEATGECVDVETPMLRGDVFEHLLLKEEFIYPVTPLIRRECYERFPPDPAMTAEGEALWTKMAMLWHVDFVDEAVGVMRHHERNSGRNWERNYRESIAYWERFFADPATPPRVRALRRKKLARMHRVAGLIFLRDAGDAQMAGRALLSSIQERPSQLITDWRVPAGLLLAFLGRSRLNPDALSRPTG